MRLYPKERHPAHHTVRKTQQSKKRYKFCEKISHVKPQNSQVLQKVIIPANSIISNLATKLLTYMGTGPQKSG
jgi:hypothetical protein